MSLNWEMIGVIIATITLFVGALAWAIKFFWSIQEKLIKLKIGFEGVQNRLNNLEQNRFEKEFKTKVEEKKVYGKNIQ